MSQALLAGEAPSGSMDWPAQMAKLAVPAFFLNLGIVLFMFLQKDGIVHPYNLGNVTDGVGRLFGLLAAYLCLVQLLVIGRNPFLDRVFGLDRMTRWHRVIGESTFTLIVLHVVFIVTGYSAIEHNNVIEESAKLFFHTPDIVMAVSSFVLFSVVVGTSLMIVRKRLRYETWYYVHFYSYLAIALALPHQIAVGSDFAKTSFSQTYWAVLYAVSISSLFGFRLLLPLINAFQQRLVVDSVVRENEHVVSIYIAGRDVSKLGAQAGQFFIWRFLTRGQWWQAHPYSLSQAPPEPGDSNNLLRITVKDAGRGSGELAKLTPGTRILAEGPYGAFTTINRAKSKVLFIAAGVGITPIRAMLESIPARDGDITLLYRAHSKDDFILTSELESIAMQRNAKLHLIAGSRSDFPKNRQPLGPKHIKRLVPDVTDRDVYMCGPPQLIERTQRALQLLGVPKRQIHHEAFSLTP